MSAGDFLHWWFDEATSDEVVAVTSIGASTRSYFFDAGEWDRIGNFIEDLSVDGDVYVRTTTLSSRPQMGRGTKSDTSAMFGFALDIDGAWGIHKTEKPLPATVVDALKPLGDHPPSAVVSSGGGLYAFWKLDAPVRDRATAEALLRRWGVHWKRVFAEHGYHVDNVSELSRILRVPGTLNHKFDTPVSVEVADRTGEIFTLAEIESWLPELPDRPERSNGAERIPGSPWDAVRCEDGHRLLANALIDQGWTEMYARNGEINLLRPGSLATKSLTIGGEINGEPAWGQVQVWSDAIEGMDEGAYSVGQVAALLLFGGDNTACRAWLIESGFGEDRADASSYLASVAAVPLDEWPRLPDEFWLARPEFQHIKVAAEARGCSPDAVLDAVISRFAAQIHQSFVIPPINGGIASLTYFSAIIGPSGLGKSSAVACAADLLRLPMETMERPIGTGEGMAEAFMDEITVQKPDGSGSEKKKIQTKHHLWVNVDEGRVLVDLEARDGATLGETMRRAWTGQQLGQGNANRDHRRQVYPHSYNIGVVMGLQVDAAASMFTSENIDLGSAQRWMLSPVQRTPRRRPRPPRPEWPGPLELRYRTHEIVNQMPGDRKYSYPSPVKEGESWAHFHLWFDPEIVRWVIDHHDDKMEGYLRIDPLDSHEPLHKLKLAAIYALLDGRWMVSPDDWRLAEIRWDAHVAMRRVLLQRHEAQAQVEELNQEQALRRRLEIEREYRA